MLVVRILTTALGLGLLVGGVIRDSKLSVYLPDLPALILVPGDSTELPDHCSGLALQQLWKPTIPSETQFSA